MTALGFLITALFFPGLSGAATAPRWAFLSIAIPLLFPNNVRITTAHVLLCCFIGWAALSLAWSPLYLDASLQLWFLILFAGAFCIGSELPDLRKLFIGAAMGMTLSSAAAIAQVFFNYKGIAQYAIPGGLFINPIMLGEISALVLLGLIVHRLWYLIPCVAPAMLLSGARGAWLGLIVGLVAWTRSRALAALCLTVLIAGSWHAYNTNWRIDSIQERFAIWSDTYDGLTWRGRGVGSFYGQYPDVASRTDTLKARPNHAHNDILEIAFELGIAGAGLVVALCGVLLSHHRGRHWPVFIAFLVMGLFGFPLHNPATAFIAAMVAGHLAYPRSLFRADMDGWRNRFRSWRAAPRHGRADRSREYSAIRSADTRGTGPHGHGAGY